MFRRKEADPKLRLAWTDFCDSLVEETLHAITQVRQLCEGAKESKETHVLSSGDQACDHLCQCVEKCLLFGLKTRKVDSQIWPMLMALSRRWKPKNPALPEQFVKVRSLKVDYDRGRVLVRSLLNEQLLAALFAWIQGDEDFVRRWYQPYCLMRSRKVEQTIGHLTQLGAIKFRLSLTERPRYTWNCSDGIPSCIYAKVKAKPPKLRHSKSSPSTVKKPPLHSISVFRPFFTKQRVAVSDPLDPPNQPSAEVDKAEFEKVKNSGKIILLRDASRAVDLKWTYRQWLRDFSPRDAEDPERGSRISSRAGITSAFAQAWIGAGGTFTDDERRSMELTPEEKHQQQLYLLTKQRKIVPPKEDNINDVTSSDAKKQVNKRLRQVRVVCHGRVYRLNLLNNRDDPYKLLNDKLLSLLGPKAKLMNIAAVPFHVDAAEAAKSGSGTPIRSSTDLLRALDGPETKTPTVKLCVYRPPPSPLARMEPPLIAPRAASMPSPPRPNQPNLRSNVQDHYYSPPGTLRYESMGDLTRRAHQPPPSPTSAPPPPPPPATAVAAAAAAAAAAASSPSPSAAPARSPPPNAEGSARHPQEPGPENQNHRLLVAPSPRSPTTGKSSPSPRINGSKGSERSLLEKIAVSCSPEDGGLSSLLGPDDGPNPYEESSNRVQIVRDIVCCIDFHNEQHVTNLRVDDPRPYETLQQHLCKKFNMTPPFQVTCRLAYGEVYVSSDNSLSNMLSKTAKTAVQQGQRAPPSVSLQVTHIDKQRHVQHLVERDSEEAGRDITHLSTNENGEGKEKKSDGIIEVASAVEEADAKKENIGTERGETHVNISTVSCEKAEATTKEAGALVGEAITRSSDGIDSNEPLVSAKKQQVPHSDPATRSLGDLDVDGPSDVVKAEEKQKREILAEVVVAEEDSKVRADRATEDTESGEAAAESQPEVWID
mmetsp:Transcript_21430/g.41590  ORF Transcript_21430/g.41590 Transcript_21430/m.41590 type:complete len:936 (+) Transcript_21430:44-2851(+)